MPHEISSCLSLLFFAANVHAVELPKPVRTFIDAHCVDCHDADSKKGGLDFDALALKLDEPANEARWTLAFDRVLRHEMPPKKREQPSQTESEAFMKSLGAVLSEHDVAKHASTGRVLYRRLNRAEYENTMHDLLAIDTPLVAMLPEDGSAHGFDNVSEGLRLSAAQIEAYLLAADKCLDAAIELHAKPEAKTKRVSYLDLAQLKEVLAKPTGSISKEGQRHHQGYRALPDALVIFHNETFGGTTLRDLRANVTGNYRVRLSGYGYQSTNKPQMVAKVMITTFVRNRPGAMFDLPLDKPRLMEAIVRLDEGELLYMSAAGCDYAPDGTHVQDIGGETYTGSGMAIQWVEMEGPLLESWPPPSVQRVFGDLEIKPIEKPKYRGRAYELLAKDAAADVERLVIDFAKRAFRQPATSEETARYLRLAKDALAEGGTVEAAVRRASKAILVAPEFLFLQEKPGKLDDYALASRLSYFLWSTMPDAELLRLAAQGQLREPATLRAQTERMLKHDKAHALTRNFCGQWLNLRAIDATTPDRRLYPEFDELLQPAMVSETEAFFEEVLQRNLGIGTFIDSDFAMLNRRLAEHYGIEGVVGEEFRKVALPAGSHRGGLLTQASILKVTANGTLSSPVTRGSWVLKRILGHELQPQPAGVGTIEPDTRGSTTIREQLAKHRSSDSCAACHQYMDPPGFALESYDVIGGWREKYRTQGKGDAVIDTLTKRGREYRLGAPVDPTGELSDGRAFTDIDGLKKLLRNEEESVARNLTNNLIAYATGAGVTFADRTQVEAILRRTKATHYGLRSLIHEVVQSPLFQAK